MKKISFGFLVACIFGMGLAFAASDGEPAAGHSDPFALILIELSLVILMAVLGRWAAGQAKQPAVLGELLIGMVIGNLGYWLGQPFFTMVMYMGEANQVLHYAWNHGVSIAEAAHKVLDIAAFSSGGSGAAIEQYLIGDNADDLIRMLLAIWMFSSLGVILLLFMVGLESSVEEMKHVGMSATKVAVVGIVAPMLLSLGCTLVFLPEASMNLHLFIAATLCATSVGITARVFKDLNSLHLPEAKVILGAAVIDDILGLVILAVVAGLVVSGGINVLEIGRIVLLSAIFLGVLVVFGEKLMDRLHDAVRHIESHNLPLLFPLTVAFVLSWAAAQIELASIVGAFAAGLILHDHMFHHEAVPDQRTISKELGPLETIFAPIFFVLMGMQVNLALFFNFSTLILAVALIVAAVVGKVIAGFVAGGGKDALTIGIGMVPRGEVGLIFASVGRGLGVIDGQTFSAVVIMVMVTTLLAPFALKWSLSRHKGIAMASATAESEPSTVLDGMAAAEAEVRAQLAAAARRASKHD